MGDTDVHWYAVILHGMPFTAACCITVLASSCLSKGPPKRVGCLPSRHTGIPMCCDYWCIFLVSAWTSDMRREVTQHRNLGMSHSPHSAIREATGWEIEFCVVIWWMQSGGMESERKKERKKERMNERKKNEKEGREWEGNGHTVSMCVL